MSTLVSTLLAVVMKVLTLTTLNTPEIESNVNRIDVEEVLLFMEDFPTITPLKNC